MRAFITSAIGVTCSAALVLPNAAPAGAAPDTSATAATDPADPAEVSGSTQSLPLSPLPDASTRATDAPSGTAEANAVQGLPRRDVHPFSLVGVVWDEADVELHGAVEVRTRAIGSDRWSDWQDLETHNAEHAADPGSAERDSETVRGSTAPLWVGNCDGVEVRVIPEAPDGHDRARVPLPEGLRLELVDPGEDPQQSPVADTDEGDFEAAGAEFADLASGSGGRLATSLQASLQGSVRTSLQASGRGRVLPALSKAQTEAAAGVAPGSKPYIGPRPTIITRKGWGADEKLREKSFAYTKSVKAAFIHHSATGNKYTCSQAPSVLRGIYRYHVKSSGWRDIGYNFAVDKCGNIYEGRAGGVTKAVQGAHTLGFNTDSMGIAVLGTFTTSDPPAAAVNAIAKLTAWKLGLFGANPSSKATLVSGGGNRFKKGTKVKLNVISGHRDGFATECPGTRLYKKLGSARTSSAHLQGR
ncbi:N-acetylmuramoyl-L-alanine amidase [Streptomyces sp. NRRL S-1824]|uniref:N-acetylmuramoyl-L-alanine amidase n=1 Tax=Streptomyces sp. NRRL S-1824 TaxID=1463889 RepID=UPI0004C4D4C1|nr:N-acetylmuramoyl-L-alanine amidase [Streptomyces sp. NRRL S-1824]